MYKVGDIIKKGFTLIEILAVVTIIGLLFILVIPKITNSLNSKKEDIDNTTNNLIISATKQYINNNIDDFNKGKDNVYCMPLTTLVKEKYLDKVIDKDNKDITYIKSVKITYDKSFKYEIVNKSECRAEYLPSMFKDDAGNEYVRVEYLESTGTQYIDTGYIPNNNTGFTIDFLTNDYLSGSNYGCIFGSRKAAHKEEYQLSTYSADGMSGVFRLNSHSYNSRITSNIRMNVSYLNNIYTNSNNVTESIVEPEFTSPSTLTIFALNNDNSVVQYGKLQLYNFKLYDNGNLIRDYIPVLNITNKKACFYDRVENKCYYNQGTGEFKFKYLNYYNYNDFDYVDKDGNKLINVNYLESTGAQYIDTGYIPNNNTGFTIDFLTNDYLSGSNYGCIFGSRKFSGNKEYQLSTYSLGNTKGIFRLNSHTYNPRITSNIRMNVSYLNNIYTNSNNVEESIVESEFTSPSTLTIFALNNDNSVVQHGKLQLYNLKLYDNGNLVRDYIPTFDITNIKPCLYDKVENKCYYNQGTGEFLFDNIKRFYVK